MNNFLKQTYDTVFVMLGSGCNFQCKYCLQHPIMTDPICSTMNPDLIEFLESRVINQEKSLRVMFFGGEPLLYWENIVNIVDKIKSGSYRDRFNFALLTNGSLLDMDKVEYLNTNNISIGVSWDGINTSNTRGADVLKDPKIRKCFFELNHVAISAVLSSENYPLDIVLEVEKLNKEYKEYREANNLPIFIDHLNLVIDEIMDTGLEHKYLTDVDLDRVYKDMTAICDNYRKACLGDEYNPFEFKYLDKYIQTLKYRVNADMRFSMARCGNGYNVLNVDLDGNLYFCHNSSRRVGTIYDSYFSYLEKVIECDTTKNNNQKCAVCCVQDLCQNGCPLICQEVRDRYYCELKRAVFYPIIELVMDLGNVEIESEG